MRTFSRFAGEITSVFLACINNLCCLISNEKNFVLSFETRKERVDVSGTCE